MLVGGMRQKVQKPFAVLEMFGSDLFSRDKLCAVCFTQSNILRICGNTVSICLHEVFTAGVTVMRKTGKKSNHCITKLWKGNAL